MNPFWQYVLIFFLVAVEGAGVTLAAAALAGTGVLQPLVHDGANKAPDKGLEYTERKSKAR